MKGAFILEIKKKKGKFKIVSTHSPVSKVSAEKMQVGTLTKKIHIQVPICIFSADTLLTGSADTIWTTFKKEIHHNINENQIIE